MNAVLFAIPFVFLSACASYTSDVYTAHHADRDAIADINSDWFVKFDFNKPVIVRGVADNHEPTNTGSMVYSGDAGMVGFLAQIAAHSAVSSSMEGGRLSENQEKANEVLVPLLKILQGLNQESLTHESDQYKFLSNNAVHTGITLESYPAFYVSQDLKCITLKHLVKVYKDEEDILYQNHIQIISSLMAGDGPEGALNAENDLLLKSTVKSLYKRSLRVALTDIAGGYEIADKKQRSYKFREGKKLRVERGTNVGNDHGSTIIRNLRGWLLAFPDDSNDEDASSTEI